MLQPSATVRRYAVPGTLRMFGFPERSPRIGRFDEVADQPLESRAGPARHRGADDDVVLAGQDGRGRSERPPTTSCRDCSQRLAQGDDRRVSVGSR